MVHERWRRLEVLVTSLIRSTDKEFLVGLHDNLDLIDETVSLDCSTLTSHCICTVNFEYLHKPEHVIKCLRKRKCFHCQRYQCMRREHETITASTRLILLAAALGKFQVFKFLHQRGSSLESKTGVHELRPIHLAIVHGHFNIFCYLLAHQVDINAIMKSNGTSYSPLMQAVLYNRKEMIRHLLMVKGLDLSFRNSLSQSPILFAVQQNNLDLMDLLLGAEEAYLSRRYGRSSDRVQKLQHPCAVLEAIQRDNAEVLKTLLDNGCDVDYMFNGYHSYTTAAILAAVKNSHRSLKLLVSRGADVTSEIDGFSAFDWARHLGWTECLYALEGEHRKADTDNGFTISAMGNKTDQPSNDGEHGHGWAAQGEILIERNDICELPTVHGMVHGGPMLYLSPMLAVWKLVQWINVDDELRRLESIGHNVNVQDSYGRTSLHLAVEEQHVYGVRALLNLGADTEITDCCGATPFWHAVFWNKESMVKELIAANAKLECNAIENAYKLGHSSAENYQDPNIQQNSGVYKTTLGIAVEKNFHETSSLLIEAGYDTSEDNIDKLADIAKDDSKYVLIRHLNEPKTLFASTRNFLRREYGAKIHHIANQYYLPTRIRDCLLLKDVIECAYNQR